MSEKNIASYIDHTLLKPNATKNDIMKIVEEALEYQFASVCVHPHWVDDCYQKVKGSEVKVCTVIGFPLGSNTTETKVFETKQALKNGATEIDMVINIGALKSNNDSFVRQDIAAVVDAAKGAITKVIIETALLSENEIVKACQLAKQANADFVKTSTGFSSGGATIKDIKRMRQTVGPLMGIKASGGVRDFKTAQLMIAAGATRIGASASIDIVTEK